MTRNSQIFIKFILLQLLLLTSISEILADDLKLRPENFTHFTIEDGLPQNNVRCIEEDQYGILWLCTADGIVRYDGYEFESIYEGAEGSQISNSAVRDILPDGDNLWIATERGLNKFNLVTGEFEQVKLVSQSKEPEIIRSLLKIKDGELWVGARDGIYVLTYYENIISNISKYHDGINARDMILINKKVIVANYGQGILEVDVDSKAITKIKSFDTNYANNAINITHHDGLLYVSTYGDGLIILDLQFKKIINVRACELKPLKCLLGNFLWFTKYFNNELWVSSTKGITVLEPSSLNVKRNIKLTSFIKNKYISNSIKSVHFMDNYLWFGLVPGGIVKYRLPNNGVDNYRINSNNSILSDRSVYSVAINKNVTYVGTYSGLFKIDEKNNRLEAVSSVNSTLIEKSQRISSMCFYDEHLFFGTANGLFKYNVQTKSLLKFPLTNDENIRSVNCEPEQLLIAAYSGNVFKYYEETNKFNLIGKIKEKGILNSIFHDEFLYVSTTVGIEVYMLIGDDLVYKEALMKNKDVIGVASTDTMILIGTKGHGLYYWNKILKNEIKVELDYHIIGNLIYDISIINNYAWLATNNGLLKLDLKSFQYSHYVQPHGLGDKEYSINGLNYDKSTDTIYAAGLTGLTRIKLQKFKNNFNTKNLISKISVINDKGEILKNYYNNPSSLNIDEGNTILFQLGNKDSPLRYQSNFNYKIKKYSSEVITMLRSNQQLITLVDVSGSDFNFLIGDGNIYSLDVNVLPYLWKRWWSYIIYFVMIALLLRAIFMQQISIRETKHREIMSNKELDLKRKQLASLSHELRTPLNAIIGITESTTDAVEDLKHIKSSAHLLRSLIDNALDSISLEMNNSINIVESSFSIKSLINNIIEILNLYIVSSNMTISINIDENVPRKIYTDKIRVQQILLNLIKNALKHSSTATQIVIDVSYSNNVIKISVADNGIGIEYEDQNIIFDVFYKVDSKKSGFGLGLYISKLISNELGGDLVLESEVGLGCTFSVQFPVGDITEDKVEHESIAMKKNERLKKLLILEDDPLNVYALKTQFKNLDFINYEIVSDYNAFMSKNLSEHDGVILDLNFGHETLNGIDLAKSLKASNFTGCVYLLTAEDDSLIKQDAMNYVTGYIVKPIPLKALEKIICAKN